MSKYVKPVISLDEGMEKVFMLQVVPDATQHLPISIRLRKPDAAIIVFR